MPFTGDFYGTDYTGVDLGQVLGPDEPDVEMAGSAGQYAGMFFGHAIYILRAHQPQIHH